MYREEHFVLFANGYSKVQKCALYLQLDDVEIRDPITLSVLKREIFLWIDQTTNFITCHHHDHSMEYKQLSATHLPRGNASETSDPTDTDDNFVTIHRFGMDSELFQREQTSEIGGYDILCGRHKAAFNNIGNRRFRITVALALDRYLSASTRREKSNVIKSITSLVHRNGGRFLQLEHGKWIELNAERAHKKVAHAMRDVSAKNLQPIKLSKQDHRAGTAEPLDDKEKRTRNVHLDCHSKKSDGFVTIGKEYLSHVTQGVDDNCDNGVIPFKISQANPVDDPSYSWLW
jgi:hypothetical protein